LTKHGELPQVDYRATFLSCRSLLWAQEMGDPRQPTKRSDSTSTLELIHAEASDVQLTCDRPRLFDRTKSLFNDASGLVGSIRIPFDSVLPAITDSKQQDPESLPPTLKKGTAAKIEYSLTVMIRFGGVIHRSERWALCKLSGCTCGLTLIDTASQRFSTCSREPQSTILYFKYVDNPWQ
jgi:hypothetical protein